MHAQEHKSSGLENKHKINTHKNTSKDTEKKHGIKNTQKKQQRCTSKATPSATTINKGEEAGEPSKALFIFYTIKLQNKNFSELFWPKKVWNLFPSNNEGEKADMNGTFFCVDERCVCIHKTRKNPPSRLPKYIICSQRRSSWTREFARKLYLWLYNFITNRFLVFFLNNFLGLNQPCQYSSPPPSRCPWVLSSASS